MSRYGTLENGVVKNAPYSVEIGGYVRVMDSLSLTEANSLGYKILYLSYPTEQAGDGMHWEQDGYSETETEIKRNWKAVKDIVETKRYSVPDLFFWLRGYDSRHPDAKRGQVTIDWLNTNNLYTIAVTTRVVFADNELFFQTIEALKTDVGFTDKEIADALIYAETTAMPDLEAI